MGPSTPSRADGRGPADLRPFSVEWDPMTFALSSLIVRTGRTAVLCSVSIDDNVPRWRKGQGWAGSVPNTDCCLDQPRNGNRGS